MTLAPVGRISQDTVAAPCRKPQASPGRRVKATSPASAGFAVPGASRLGVGAVHDVRPHPLFGDLDDAIERDELAHYDLPHGGLLRLGRPALRSGLLLTLRTGTRRMDTAAENLP